MASFQLRRRRITLTAEPKSGPVRGSGSGSELHTRPIGFTLQLRPGGKIRDFVRLARLMLLTHCKRSLRTVALLLVCFMVLTPLAGSRIFVSAALQRGEFYAGVVLHDRAAPRALHATVRAHHVATAVAAGHVSSLNLFLHLSGIFVPAVSTDWLARPSGGTLAAVTRALPKWELVFAIFEPPRNRASLP